MLLTLSVMFVNKCRNLKASRAKLLANFCGGYLMILHTTWSWFILLKLLASATNKMKRHCKQLIIFRTLILGHDYHKWPMESQNILKEVLNDHHQSSAERKTIMERLRICMKFRKEARVCDALPASKAVDTFDKEIYGEAQEQNHRVDFHNAEDVRTWWSLRQFTSIDFCDESAIIQYSITVAVVIPISFCILCFLNWITYKQDVDWHQADCKEEGPVFNAFCKLAPLAGSFLVLLVIVTTTILFWDLMMACQHINILWISDKELVIDWQIKLLWEESKRTVQRPKVDKKPTKSTDFEPLLTKMKEFDRRQKLFGKEIDGSVVSGLVMTIACAAMKLLWGWLSGWLYNMDLSYIDEFAKRMGI